MAVIDYTTDIGKVRLKVGDTLDLQLLPDQVYQDVLDENGGNVNATVRDTASMILMMLAVPSCQQRLDRIEIHSQDSFNNYLKALKEVIKNPNSSMNLAGIYAAGVYVDDVIANMEDPNVIQKRQPWGGEEGMYTVILNPYGGEHF